MLLNQSVDRLLKSFLFFISSLAAVFVLSFFLLHALPGDPADIILGEEASLSAKTALNKQLGLDLPLSQQFTQQALQFVKGDWGKSLRNGEPTTKRIAGAFKATLGLAGFAFVLIFIFGIGLGALSTFFGRHGFVSGAFVAVTTFGSTIPVFVFAPLLVYVFSIWLAVLPVSGKEGWTSFILPVCSLAFGSTCYVARVVRELILAERQKDYVRFARAQGENEFKILFGNVLPVARSTIATILLLQMASLLTGAVVTEAIFDWPGVGQLFYTSITGRDYPLVQSCVVFIALIYFSITFFLEIIYPWLDPRIET